MTRQPFAPIISAQPATPATIEAQRPYEPPAIVYEASLEVRAGTPLDIPTNLLELP